MFGDLRRKGVRRVDQEIDAIISDVTRQPLDAAESADTRFTAGFGGIAGGTGERINYAQEIA